MPCHAQESLGSRVGGVDMEYLPVFLMIAVALLPTVAGLIMVYLGDRQFQKGLQGLTDPKNY